MNNKPYNIKCPACKNENAYKGFLKIECPNFNCKFYTDNQRETVENYKNKCSNKETSHDPYKDYMGYYVKNEVVEEDLEYKDDDESLDTIPNVDFFGTPIS